MTEAGNNHGICDRVLQAFIAGGKFAGAVVKYRIGLRHHHDSGRFPIAQGTDGVVDRTALGHSYGLLIKKLDPDHTVFEELSRSKIKADTFYDFHNLKVIYFLEESNFTNRFM